MIHMCVMVSQIIRNLSVQRLLQTNNKGDVNTTQCFKDSSLKEPVMQKAGHNEFLIWHVYDKAWESV